MSNTAHTVNGIWRGDEAHGHEEPARFNCDGTCGYSYPVEERANPAGEAEAFCGPCYAEAGPWNPDAEDAAPEPADPGRTERLAVPGESMASLVFGGAA
jgi:hypothetical protein